MIEKTYLGDGVYASFDGYQIKLETLEGMVIYLEPSVLDLVNMYYQRATAPATATEERDETSPTCMVQGCQRPSVFGWNICEPHIRQAAYDLDGRK